MAWQQFGTLAAGNEPVSLFDVLSNQIAPNVVIPCVASGSNAIALAGTTNAPALAAYSDVVSFVFVSTANSTGPVTAQFGGLASLAVYFSDGVTQVANGGIFGGQPYKLTWNQTLNSGAGGFYLDQWAQPVAQAVATTHGYNLPLNMQVNATAASGVLTVALKDASTGNDPTSSNPINVSVRDPNNTGTLVQVNITTGFSVSTFAVGATLGAPNNTAFSLWLVLFKDPSSGNSYLGLIYLTGAQQINESVGHNATGFSAAATSVNTFYIQNGTNLSGDMCRVLARLDFAANANLAAGWVAPGNIQLMRPAIPPPGQQNRVLLNTLTASNSASLSDTTSFLLGYENYEVVFENMVPATVSQDLRLQVISGGTTQTTTYIYDTFWVWSGTFGTGAQAAYIVLTPGSGLQVAGLTGGNGTARIIQPTNTAGPKAWLVVAEFPVSGHTATNVGTGYWNGGNGAITGFVVSYASGNITSGTIRVYGLGP